MTTYALRAATLFIVPLLLARLAGPELLGEFITLIALAALFGEFSTFGLHILLTREVARLRDDKKQVARLINVSLGLVITLSTLIFLIMVGMGVWLDYSGVMLRALILTAMALIIEALTRIIMATLYGTEEMEWVSAIAFAGEVVFLGLILVTIPIHLAIDWLMAAYLISRITSFAAGVWIYRPRFGWLRPTVDQKMWLTLSKKSFLFLANEVVCLVDGRLGIIILSILAGNVAVGLFEAAMALTIHMNVLARAVNQALYPFLSSQFMEGERLAQFHTAKGIQYLIIPGFLVATLLVVFGKDIVLFLYGEEFRGAINALKLLALLIPLRFASQSLATLLTATNRQEKRFAAVTIAAVMHLILSLVLIPSYQLIGAAWAMALTQIVTIGLQVWYLRAEINEIIQWRTLIAPGVGSFLIVWSSLLSDKINIWLMILLSVLLYTVAVIGLDRSIIASLLMIAPGNKRERYNSGYVDESVPGSEVNSG